jgi:hypothetical protein
MHTDALKYFTMMAPGGACTDTLGGLIGRHVHSSLGSAAQSTPSANGMRSPARSVTINESLKVIHRVAGFH